MKVKELIKMLSKLDQDKEIMTIKWDYEQTMLIDEKPSILTADKFVKEDKEHLYKYHRDKVDAYVIT